MQASDYLRVFAKHPQRAEISYRGISALGVYEEIEVEIFTDAIQRIYKKQLTVIKGTFDLDKKNHPDIYVDATSYKIIDHYNLSTFLTMVVLK